MIIYLLDFTGMDPSTCLPGWDRDHIFLHFCAQSSPVVYAAWRCVDPIVCPPSYPHTSTPPKMPFPKGSTTFLVTDWGILFQARLTEPRGIWLHPDPSLGALLFDSSFSSSFFPYPLNLCSLWPIPQPCLLMQLPPSPHITLPPAQTGPCGCSLSHGWTPPVGSSQALYT